MHKPIIVRGAYNTSMHIINT